jgi:hypothetical protein
LAGIEAALFQFAERHAIAPRLLTFGNRLNGDVIQEANPTRLAVECADTNQAARSGHASIGGQAEDNAVFSAPEERV